MAYVLDNMIGSIHNVVWTSFQMVDLRGGPRIWAIIQSLASFYLYIY